MTISFEHFFATPNNRADIIVGAIQKLRDDFAAGKLPILSVARQNADLTSIEQAAKKFRGLRDVIILGTGGSSLGAKSIYRLIDDGYGPRPGGAKLHFMDNVDPVRFASMLMSLSPENTGIIAISKSGSTAETLCQLHIAAPWIGKNNWQSRILVITEPGGNILRNIGEQMECQILDHHPQIGGRFSVLSNVGMLPAAVCGLDPAAIRAGAQAEWDRQINMDMPDAAFAAAAIAKMQRENAISQTVMMTYCDRLSVFTDWYKQLWAESLGKGGRGLTPIGAIGTVDQHSQLQLFLDGPRDKFFTLITAKQSAPITPVEPIGTRDERLAYLYGRSMADLFEAEAEATIATIKNQRLPLRVIRLDRVDSATIGGLFMHFMMETILTAAALGVNPYDQPAVEEGKILTREFLSRKTA